jgi:hypothetical protein
MDANQAYQKEVEEYLAENQVYDGFEEMMRALVNDMPKDPVEYLLNHLKSQNK